MIIVQIDKYGKLYSRLIRLKQSKFSCEIRKLNGPEKNGVTITLNDVEQSSLRL